MVLLFRELRCALQGGNSILASTHQKPVCFPLQLSQAETHPHFVRHFRVGVVGIQSHPSWELGTSGIKENFRSNGFWDEIEGQAGLYQAGREGGMVLEAEVTHTGGRWGGAGGSVGLGERLVRTRTSAVAGDRTARVGKDSWSQRQKFGLCLRGELGLLELCIQQGKSEIRCASGLG